MSTNIKLKSKINLFNATGGKCFWCNTDLIDWKIDRNKMRATNLPTVEHIFFKKHFMRHFRPFNDQRRSVACLKCNSSMGGAQSKAKRDSVSLSNKVYLGLNSFFEKPRKESIIIRDFQKIKSIVYSMQPKFRLALFGGYVGRRFIDYYLAFNQIVCADDYAKYQEIQLRDFAEFVRESKIN